MIAPDDGLKLVRLARESIATSFSDKYPSTVDTEKLSQQRGVFVTLHENSELRGCIGYIEQVMPLYKAVIDASRAAAFHDPRFPPLEKRELGSIKIEVSVLTEPQLIDVARPEEYPDKIKIGKDGLILRSGHFSGLLLPQVPVEQGWEVNEYLAYIGLKAGLSRDAWKEPGAKLYKFQAQVFSE